LSFRYFILLVVLNSYFALAASNSEKLKRPAIKLKQVELGSKYVHADPLLAFVSKDGSLWTLYDQHVVRKQGNRVQEYKLPGDSSTYFTLEYSSLAKAVELKDALLFSYNSQILIYNKSKNDWKLWQDLPFENELITGLQVLENGTIWVSTLKGLFFTETTAGSFTEHLIPKEFQHDRSEMILATMMSSNQSDTLYIGSFLSTFFRIRFNDKSEPEYQKIIFKDTNNRILLDIKNVDNKSLLIGASDGLFSYDLENSELVRLTSIGAVEYVNNIQFSNEHIWFHAQEKIYLKNKNSDETLLLTTENLPFASSSYAALGLYSDRDENLWLAVRGNGLLQYSPFLNRVRPSESALYDARNLTLMTTSLSNQVVISDDKITYLADKQHQLAAASYSYFEDNKYLYLGGMGKVVQYSGNTKIADFEIPGIPASLMSLAVTGDSLWAVDSLKGLFVFSVSTGVAIDTTSIEEKGENKARYVALTEAGQIILVSNNEIKIVKASEQDFTILETIDYQSFAIKTSLQNGHIITHHRDGRVSLFSLVSREIKYFDFTEISNLGCSIYSIDKEWWVAEKNGDIFHYAAEGDTPTKLTEADGVPFGGVDGLHCLEVNDTLFFTSHSGVVKTQKLFYRANEYSSDTIISSVLAGTNKLDHRVSKNGGELAPQDFPLTIDFHPTSLTYPASNLARYKLRSSDDWQPIESGSQQLVFNQLDQGEYDLVIQTSNSDGYWGKQDSLAFTVVPPIWFSWWAITSYLIIFFGMSFLLAKFRTKALTKRAEKLEATVAERTHQLEQVLDQKNEEFANVSHEFRTPLTLVIGPLQRLLSQEEDSSKKSSLSMVKRNAYRLLRMVDQLLHLEKFRVQQITTKTVINVRPIAKLIGESFTELAHEKGITMSIKKLDEVWLHFTPDALEKILLNLLSNSIKYSSKGDSIEFSIEALEKDRARIIVKDTGIGIPKEKHAEIFGRFTRVLDSHSEQITGAGIGLSLVKELVDSHGGTIELESALGSGSCFSVSLPTCKAPDVVKRGDSDYLVNDADSVSDTNIEILDMEIESLVEQAKQRADDDSSKEVLTDNLPTILVVEDNQDMRSYIASTLSARFNVLTAVNGEDGLQLAREHIPDLIVSDVMMPKMDGFTLCQSLKSDELTNHIPLILLTARSDRESRIRGWKEHADEYLTKPFDAEELGIRVNNLLGIRELLKQRFYSSIQAEPERLEQDGDNKANPEDDNAQWEQHQRVFLNRFIEQIELNLTNVKLKVDLVAKNMSMTERQLYRKLKGIANVTPAEYMKNYRLDKALTLIQEGEPVGNVSFDVGFASHSYFSKCFKAKFGKSPSEYVESN
jgi:signal transduction histidine kinase/DNA-binding response OmpR family regulator/ligand-binding sensor domain-containing protein